MKLLLGIKGKGTEFVFRPYDFYENIASKRTLSSKTTNEEHEGKEHRNIQKNENLPHYTTKKK